MARRRTAARPPDHATSPGPRANPIGTRAAGGRVRGTVLSSDAASHVYLVATPGGAATMGRLRAFPGDLGIIPNGTAVLIDYALGEPYIAGLLPPGGARGGGTSLTGVAGTDPVLTTPYGATARGPDDPVDVLPGDAVVQGPDGAHVAALGGRTATLHGGRLAQVLACGDADLVQVVAGVFRLLTWMGELRVENTGGKTSLVFRGGSDQLTQTGPDEERYTLRLDLGATGDLVNFEVTTPDGQALFRVHVDPAGRLSVYAAGGVDHTDGGRTTPVRLAGDRETDVRGRDTTTIGGTTTTRHGGARTTTVAGPDVVACTADMTTHLAGVWRLVTTVPDGVRVGRNPVFHAVKFEPLEAWREALQADYNAFKAAVVGHIHPASSGTTAPSAELTGRGTAFTADAALAKSDDLCL